MNHGTSRIPVKVYKFFKVFELPKEGSRKTSDYELIAFNGRLGRIDYYARWRQYVLAPEESTVWSLGCLLDVIDCIRSLQDGLKKKVPQ